MCAAAERRPRVKNDPKLVPAAWELRDRWLERVKSDPLPAGRSGIRRQPWSGARSEGIEAPAIAAVSGLSQAAMKNGTGPTW